MSQNFKIIKDVSSYKISEGSLYFKDNESLFNRSLFKNGTLVYKNGVTGFQITSKFLYYSNWNNETFKRDLINNNETKIDFDQVGDYMLDNKIVFRKNENYFIEDTKNKSFYKIPDEFYFYKNFLSNDFYISTNVDYHSIHCFSIVKRSQIWQYDLSTLAKWKDSTDTDQSYELKEFIGMIDTSLFIKLNANEILVLDVNTGKVSERLRFIDYFEGETCIERPYPEIPFFQTRYVINQDKSIIQGLFLDLYYEVSFKNGKSYTRVFGLKKEYEKWGINPRNISKENVLFNDKLYFLAYEQGRFGILNTITKEIDYVSEPIAIGDRSNNFTQLKEIQVSNDKVYVLASDRTLHVFEKSNR